MIRERAAIASFTVTDPGETHEAVVTTEVPSELGGRPEAELYIEEPDGTLRMLFSALTSGGKATVAFKPAQQGDHTLIANVASTSPERITFSTTIRTGMWAFESFGIACLVSALLGAVLFLGGGFGRIK